MRLSLTVSFLVPQLAPTVGLSYEAVVRLRLKQGKCPRDVWEGVSRVVPWDLLGDPRGGKEDRKGARIGSACEERKSLAWEKGRIRPVERCRVSRDTGSMMIETES